jgi:spore coat polysaccharide biosynthesis protein SpsF
MTSRRLPGKVLLEAAGKPMLAHLISRLKRCPTLDGIVVATTTNATDDPLAALAGREGVGCFRGSESDVMSRVLGAAEAARAEVIVEITGDCPVIDPMIVDQTIRLYRHNPCDYASNVQVRSYPIGMDTQVFSTATLRRSFETTDDPWVREHVTPHIRKNPDLFRQVTLVAAADQAWPELGLVLDEPSDYVLLKNVIEYFDSRKPDYDVKDMIVLLRSIHPEWVDLNSAVVRTAAKKKAAPAP